MEWTIDDSVMIGKYKEYSNTLIDSNKLHKFHFAMFDLDDTIIKHSFKDIELQILDEMKLFINNIKDTHNIIIISNQKNLRSVKSFQDKIDKLALLLNVTFEIYVSLHDDIYRKPRPEIYNKYISDNVSDISDIFYVGDAGGNNYAVQNNTLTNELIKKSKLPKKDFSDSDILFAANCKIKFIHAYDIIYKLNSNNYIPIHPYTNYVNSNNITNYIEQYNNLYQLFDINKTNIIFNIGLPASGKTYFTKKYLSNFFHVNQDNLVTSARCINVFKLALQQYKNIVIDNTNLSKMTREIYHQLTKNYNCNIIYIIFNTPINLCIHNNNYRYLYNKGKKIPKVVYNKMIKLFLSPIDDTFTNHIFNLNFYLEEPIDNNYYLYL